MAKNDNFPRILSDLKRKQYRPIYFLHGEETYFIDTIAETIEAEALTEAEKAFNQTILYGKKDMDVKIVVDAARRYPMGAERQVVILKEAQQIDNLDGLQSYVENPSLTTILVICHPHKRLRMNTALGKALKKQAEVLDARHIYDDKVPNWIETYLRSKKLIIRPPEAALIAEYLGSKLSKVANELDKLALNVPEGSTISEEDVERYIGISREYNIFELQKAIGFRETQKAFRIVQNFASNPKKHPLVVTVGMLYTYFSKVYLLHEIAQKPNAEIQKALKLSSPYFLKEYRLTMRNYSISQLERVFGILHEYDLKSKGVRTLSTTDGQLLQEMVWKILQ